MRTSPRPRAAAFAIIASLALAACATAPVAVDLPPVQPHVAYKPPFLPISFTIDSSGVQVSGDASFVTPIGVFSIGASMPIVATGSRDILLVLRNRATATDVVYRIREGQGARIVVDGHTEIRVTSTTVVVEVIEGQILEVSAPTNTPEEQATAAAATAIALSPPVAGGPQVLGTYTVDLRGQEAWATTIRGLALSPDGTVLAAATVTQYAGPPSVLYLWAVDGGRALQALQFGGWVTSIAFTAGGRQVAALDGDGRVQAWDVASGAPAWELDAGARDMAFSPDGQWLAATCGSYCTGIRLWHLPDLAPAEPLTWEPDRAPADSTALAFSGDGRWLAAVSESWHPEMAPGNIVVWDFPARRLAATWPEAGNWLALDAQGGLLATFGVRDYEVTLRRLPDGAVVRAVELGDIVRSNVAFSGDGAYVAAAGDFGVGCWRAADGAQIWKQSRPEELRYLHLVAFSRTGLRFAASSGDTAYVWALAP